MLLHGPASLFDPGKFLSSGSLPRSLSRCFAFLAGLWPLSTLAAAARRHRLHGNTYMQQLLVSNMHWFVCQVSAGQPLLLTHTFLKMQKRVKQINISSSRLGEREAAASGAARMNLLMTQSVINDVAALFIIDLHSLRGRPHISGFRPAEGSQSHSPSIN